MTIVLSSHQPLIFNVVFLSTRYVFSVYLAVLKSPTQLDKLNNHFSGCLRSYSCYTVTVCSLWNQVTGDCYFAYRQIKEIFYLHTVIVQQISVLFNRYAIFSCLVPFTLHESGITRLIYILGIVCVYLNCTTKVMMSWLQNKFLSLFDLIELKY